jgi:hypothetical protein
MHDLMTQLLEALPYMPLPFQAQLEHSAGFGIEVVVSKAVRPMPIKTAHSGNLADQVSEDAASVYGYTGTI